MVRVIIKQWSPLDIPEPLLSYTDFFMDCMTPSSSQPRVSKEEGLETLGRRITKSLRLVARWVKPSQHIGLNQAKIKDSTLQGTSCFCRGKHGSKSTSYTILGFHKPFLSRGWVAQVIPTTMLEQTKHSLKRHFTVNKAFSDRSSVRLLSVERRAGEINESQIKENHV